MKNIYLLALVATTSFFACSSTDKTESKSNSPQASNSNEWELQMVQK